MILHGFMLQIIYTTVFRVIQLNDLPFTFDCLTVNSENRGKNITYSIIDEIIYTNFETETPLHFKFL